MKLKMLCPLRRKNCICIDSIKQVLNKSSTFERTQTHTHWNFHDRTEKKIKKERENNDIIRLATDEIHTLFCVKVLAFVASLFLVASNWLPDFLLSGQFYLAIHLCCCCLFAGDCFAVCFFHLSPSLHRAESQKTCKYFPVKMHRKCKIICSTTFYMRTDTSL